VLVSNADVYVTSDLRHHPALDALETPREKPLALIDISHFAAESLWAETAATRLMSIAGLEIFISNHNTDVWNEVILNASAD
jgi:putative NIF3 family GTP cyclohydrolase 1 type 2